MEADNGRSCRKPGEGGNLPGSHMTDDDCSVQTEDVWDRASERESDGGRRNQRGTRGTDEWQRETGEGRNKELKRKASGRNAKEGKGRRDKSEKEREGDRGKGKVGQHKEKRKQTDKHKKRENRRRRNVMRKLVMITRGSSTGKIKRTGMINMEKRINARKTKITRTVRINNGTNLLVSTARTRKRNKEKIIQRKIMTRTERMREQEKKRHTM